MPIAPNIGQPVGPPRVRPPVGAQAVIIMGIATDRAQLFVDHRFQRLPAQLVGIAHQLAQRNL
ncbi:hypothetical protein D3C76_1512860 [compost metagenome]